MLKIFLKLVVLMLAVALGRLGYEKAIDLPSFALRKIDLDGNSGLSKDSVLTLSGLRAGESIYRQSLNYAMMRLTSDPAMVECSIKRGLLSEIDITINMAEPVLLIKGDSLHCISREGVVLPFDKNMPVLPLITGRKFSTVRSYDRLKDPDVVYALKIYESILAISPELCARLSEINFSSSDQIRIFLSPKGTIAVLDKRDFREAVQRLAVLHNNGLLEGPRIFDLRFGPVAIESSLEKGTL